MFPDFSYFSYFLFGTSPDNSLSSLKTFGFFLSICIILTIIILVYEVKYRKILTYDNKNVPINLILSFVIVAILSAFLGGYIFAGMEKIFKNQQFSTRLLFNSGVNYLGGLVGGFLGSLLYSRYQQVSFIKLLDCIAYPLLLLYGVGRLGCHLSGDGDWGIENMAQKPSFWLLPDWTWAFNYPHNVLNKGILIENCDMKYNHQLINPVFPTSFYEFVITFILGIILWRISRVQVSDGKLFCLFLIFIGINRFFIEFIRINPKYNLYFVELSQAQIISLGLMIIALWKLNGNKIRIKS